MDPFTVGCATVCALGLAAFHIIYQIQDAKFERDIANGIYVDEKKYAAWKARPGYKAEHEAWLRKNNVPESHIERWKSKLEK